jgi:arginyl-tRNA synthetase
MQDKLKNWIMQTLKLEKEPVLMHPKELMHGDYSFFSNSQNIEEDANILRQAQGEFPEIQEIKVVGKFINFYLSRKFFTSATEEILNNPDFGKNDLLKSKKIMVEYTDPNPFKPFHIGHLMTNAIGESVARILENSGANVLRANYQGDVGLHVARAMYALLKNQEMYILKNDSVKNQAEAIGRAYAEGSNLYETDEKIKAEIDAINKKIYDRSDKEINEIYEWGFKVTMEAFEDLYKLLGTKFDLYFLESEMAPIGENIVKENTNIFKESDGAIIFKAEEYNPKLHTRVFITSNGLPTYETKELGLTLEKFKTVPDMDLSIVTTANEQMEYMKVVTQALSVLYPELATKMKHITHGMMRFASGKMGSRKGNVITGESLIKDTVSLVVEKLKDRDYQEEEKEKIANAVGVAALKYSILKQNTGGDIIYDFEKSISFEGDSGPYLQYSYARAKSVLSKAASENILPDFENRGEEIFEIEKLLYRFPEVVKRASEEYEPHYIANYLIELARSFNSFYGNNLIVKKDDKTSAYKVALTFAFSFVIKNGLHLLGISVPERM